MKTVSSPRRVHSTATLSASGESAGKSIAKCGKPNAASDPRRRSPRQIPAGLEMPGECGETTINVSAAAAMIARAVSCIADIVVTASFCRRPPTLGIRIGAWGISAPQTTRPPGWGSLTETALHRSPVHSASEDNQGPGAFSVGCGRARFSPPEGELGSTLRMSLVKPLSAASWSAVA